MCPRNWDYSQWDGIWASLCAGRPAACSLPLYRFPTFGGTERQVTDIVYMCICDLSLCFSYDYRYKCRRSFLFVMAEHRRCQVPRYKRSTEQSIEYYVWPGPSRLSAHGLKKMLFFGRTGEVNIFGSVSVSFLGTWRGMTKDVEGVTRWFVGSPALCLSLFSSINLNYCINVLVPFFRVTFYNRAPFYVYNLL